MRPLIRNLGIALFLSVIFSCHKSHDDAPSADKLRISRVVSSDTSNPTATNWVIDFVYDDQQRIDKIVYSDGIPSSGSAITPLDTFQCYYNGTAKTFFKATSTNFRTDEYFSYNNAGQVIYDSLKYTGPSYTTRNFTYVSDKILVNKNSYVPGNLPNPLTDTFLIKDNNLVEVHYGNPPYSLNNIKCDILSYDNKINPINKLNYSKCMPIDGLLGFPSFLTPGVSRNNIVTFERGFLNYQGQFTAQTRGTLTYTYNSAGLPETCIMKTEQHTYKVNYYYEQQ